MKTQNYSNHTRYYIPHHFVFYPVAAILFGICVYRSLTADVNQEQWLMFAAVIFLIGWLSFMLRQHYALMNQNRVVRLEMRFRYYRLTLQNFEELEKKLSFGQIAALRFASDGELLPLITKTIQEGLDPQAIKKSIAHWTPDHMRV